MQHLDSAGYDTDKGPPYTRAYEAHFAPVRDRPLALLELGVHRGGSLLLWRDYFPNAQICGVDLNPPDLGPQERIHMFAGDASASETFQRIERTTGLAQFDIIIDDASHYGHLAKKSFELLFEARLAPGGLYVLEDWGTGYRSGWPDGEPARPKSDIEEAAPHRWRFPSHDYGMPGYLKQLVDVLGYADVIAGGGEIKHLPIEAITIYAGLAFIRKTS